MAPKRVKIALVAAALAAAAFLSVAGSAEAQRYYRARPRYGYYVAPPTVAVVAPGFWYVGFGLFGTNILHQAGGPEPLDSGAGFSLWGGLRLNERLALELGWMESFHNPEVWEDWYGEYVDYLVLDALTADARIHLQRSGNFDPYLQGGVGVYALGRDYDRNDQSVGTGFQLGGGFDYWLGPVVTFGVRARYHGISMGPPEGYYDDVFISAATLEGSIALHF